MHVFSYCITIFNWIKRVVVALQTIRCAAHFNCLSVLPVQTGSLYDRKKINSVMHHGNHSKLCFIPDINENQRLFTSKESTLGRRREGKSSKRQHVLNTKFRLIM